MFRELFRHIYEKLLFYNSVKTREFNQNKETASDYAINKNFVFSHPSLFIERKPTLHDTFPGECTACKYNKALSAFMI